MNTKKQIGSPVFLLGCLFLLSQCNIPGIASKLTITDIDSVDFRRSYSGFNQMSEKELDSLVNISMKFEISSLVTSA